MRLREVFWNRDDPAGELLHALIVHVYGQHGEPEPPPETPTEEIVRQLKEWAEEAG